MLLRLKLDFESRACDSAHIAGGRRRLAKFWLWLPILSQKLHLRLYDVVNVLAKKHTVSADNEREMRTRDIPGLTEERAPPGGCGQSVNRGREHKARR